MAEPSSRTSGILSITKIAASFPDAADTMLLDQYLTETPSASSRVFRVYRPTPAHFHRQCDEHLYVLSGRGTFWMHDAARTVIFAPGDFVFFTRMTVHAMPEITEYPVIFLAIDTPRREPGDVVFVDPSEGTPQSFIRGW